jgi:hypothetical protein
VWGVAGFHLSDAPGARGGILASLGWAPSALHFTIQQAGCGLARASEATWRHTFWVSEGTCEARSAEPPSGARAYRRRLRLSVD